MMAKKNPARSLFPAHAGVILAGFLALIDEAAVPRTRGGDPRHANARHIIKHCSPHTRG